MAKKKKGAKANDVANETPSTAPSTEPTTPAPSSTTGASTNGDTTPKETLIIVEDKPEDKIVEADALKEKGNVAFKSTKYADAIKLYSEAISKQKINRSKLTTEPFNQISYLLKPRTTQTVRLPSLRLNNSVKLSLTVNKHEVFNNHPHN